MPASFLIAPMLISLSLIGTPVTDSRKPVDPSTAPAAESMTLEADETVGAADADTAPADQPALEQPLLGVSVDLECLAYPDGYVANCAVVSETRPGLGFGEAAVALMNGSTIASTVNGGRSTPVKFRHTIEFTPD